MKIAIHANGGRNIGFGHIMRTLVLAKELDKYKYIEVFYVCSMEEEYFKYISENFSLDITSKYIKGIEKITNEGFKIKFIRENKVLQDLKNIKADIIITDTYNVDEGYFNTIKKFFIKTIYIDDVNLHYFNVDMLINQNIGAEKLLYRVNENTKLLLGAKYAMIREEFRNTDKDIIRENPINIMITIGAADPQHITGEILSYIKELNYNFHVVVGPAFDYIDELKNFENKNIKLYFDANMSELMKKCDIAISACGSTLYELFSCKVSTIGIVIADNQERIANKLNDMSIIKNIGWYDKISKEDLINTIESLVYNKRLRETMIKKAHNIIDGNGVKRVVDEILKMMQYI